MRSYRVKSHGGLKRSLGMGLPRDLEHLEKGSRKILLPGVSRLVPAPELPSLSDLFASHGCLISPLISSVRGLYLGYGWS
jgi:hypothetical protein